MQAEVKRPLLRGSQLVRALWFDCARLGTAEAQRRLLIDWETGAQAYRVGDGYLLAWKNARRLQCDSAPGLPLSEQDGVLASAPLLAQERAGIAHGSAVLVLGARLHVHALDAGARVDPSGWLDLSAIPVYTALAMPRAADPGFSSAVPAPAPDVRALLGSALPPPSPERSAFLHNVHIAQARAGGAKPSLATTAMGAAGMLGALALQFLAQIPGRGAGTLGAPGAAPRAPSPGGDWLAGRLARLVAVTRIGRLLGWRQANYLRKMLRQFEEGNLDEALRHAISLDSPDPIERQAFGLPGRRADLTPGARAGGGGIGLDEQSIKLLRETYQRSFEMLDRAGRIDEAVFVLAELLNRRQEAVDYLEKKERVAQAAQLAETLGLPPASAVRLHCKAGNAERAVLLARLHGCFREAVAELERRRDPGAAGLRLEWAHDLAARGNLAEAALAVWPLANERARALDWLRAAEQAGGTLGVQGLLHTLVLDPEALRARQVSLQALLSAPGAEAVRQRIRACDCLLQLDGHNAATRRIAAALWRVLAAERAAGLHALAREPMARLLKLGADQVLIEDVPGAELPAAPAAAPLRSRTEPLRITFADTGLYAIEDVRALPDGGHLLALGDGGVVLARGGGRAPLRFPVPATDLVVSHNGRRALALARREKAVRVSRIDLVSGKVEDWFSAPLAFWARKYDGTVWSVVADERLMVLDATAAGRSVLWQIGDLPGEVIGFEEQGGYQALLIRQDQTVEQWRYALPARRLLGREPAPIPENAIAVLADCSHDAPLFILASNPDFGDREARHVILRQGNDEWELEWPSLPGPHARLNDGLLLLRFQCDAVCRVLNAGRAIVADIVLPDALEPRAALYGGHLLAWDRRGRVVDVDIDTAQVRMLTFG